MTTSGAGPPTSNVFERGLALFLLVALIVASLAVLEPFALILLWAVFLSITFWPVQVWLTRRLGGRHRLAAGLVVLLLALVLVAPLTLAALAAVPSVKSVSDLLADPSRWQVPPPPPWVGRIPLLGAPIESVWSSARLNAAGTLDAYREGLAGSAGWALARVVGIGRTLVKLFVAVVIVWPMLAGGAQGAALLQRFAERVGGDRAVGLVAQAARTIRAVSLGVIGTSLLAAALQTAGLRLAGIPYAPLLGVVSFVLATMQIGTTPVWVGALLWLVHEGHTGWAIFTAVWGLSLNALVGNLLGPWLISRGTGLPLTVIFLGVLGGLLTWGFLGVFLGPTLLGVGWTLLRGWLGGGAPSAPSPAAAAPPTRPPAGVA